MPAPVAGKGLASASLGLGFLGLLTAGVCGVGGLVGLSLGIAALARFKDPTPDSGRDVAWAGIVTNGLALLTIGPVILLAATLQSAGALPRTVGEEALPEPHVSERTDTPMIPSPPPPPQPALPSGAATPGRTVKRPSPSRAEVPPPPEAVRVGGTIREPTKLRNVNPVYPEIAKQARVQGIVILEATIGPAGNVTEVRVLRGVPLLDQAAIDAVKQWEYTPTLLNGVRVPVIMTVTMNFRLD